MYLYLLYMNEYICYTCSTLQCNTCRLPQRGNLIIPLSLWHSFNHPLLSAFAQHTASTFFVIFKLNGPFKWKQLFSSSSFSFCESIHLLCFLFPFLIFTENGKLFVLGQSSMEMCIAQRVKNSIEFPKGCAFL